MDQRLTILGLAVKNWEKTVNTWFGWAFRHKLENNEPANFNCDITCRYRTVRPYEANLRVYAKGPVLSVGALQVRRSVVGLGERVQDGKSPLGPRPQA